MFCPKCGIENPDNGKFCRSCGANLINVLAVVNGSFALEQSPNIENDDPDIYSKGVRNVILGFGFGLVSMLLYAMPGSTIFWLIFMIPGFCLLASGVMKILKAEAAEKEKVRRATVIQIPTFPQTQPISALPPTNTDYISPIRKSYTTDNLVVPSVTEETTQHLEVKK